MDIEKILIVFVSLALCSCGGSSTTALPDDSTESTLLTIECNDGIDNDGDGLIDWQMDLGCYSDQDATEGGFNNQLDNGWTVFEASNDTQMIYVSSSAGDDTWSGLAPEWDGIDGPKKSISAAKELIRDGYPDWLLFKRGDVWTDEIIGNWTASGTSTSTPSIIASYGDSTIRPRFNVAESWFKTQGGSNVSANRSYVRLVGLHIYMYSKDPDNTLFTGQGGDCINWNWNGGDVLIEDMRCDFAQINLLSEPTLPFVLRRSILNGNYSLDSHAQSLFTNIGTELLIEENVMYHGGWNNDFRLAFWQPDTNISNWTPIVNGCFDIHLDGNTFNIDGIDYSMASTMQDIATITESRINSIVGANSISLRYTDGGAFQLRSDTYPSGPDYDITSYSGANVCSDNAQLFNPAKSGSPESTVFNRNMYLAYGMGNTIVRGNIDANGASGGTQLRMGGTYNDNLSVDNPIAIAVGSGGNIGDVYVGGSVQNNVILGARDIDTQDQGTGIFITSNAATTYTAAPGHSKIKDLVVKNNYILKNVNGSANIKALSIGGSGEVENVEISQNVIYDWTASSTSTSTLKHYAVKLETIPGSLNNSFHNNAVVQPNGGFVMGIKNGASGFSLYSNRYWSSHQIDGSNRDFAWFSINGAGVGLDQWLNDTSEVNAVTDPVTFTDADRNLTTYMTDKGYDGEDFLSRALDQSKYNWNADFTSESFNSYIREGFTIVE